jgi:membrane associated rhomboid family serine protease
MLPLRVNIPSRGLPLVNWGLISLNVLVFIYQTGLKPFALNNFINAYGMIPNQLNLFHPTSWIPLITAMFLHGGWFHLISNMWVLFIFGDNIEDRMGHARYLGFYLLGGIFANLLEALILPKSGVPAIGASGAIAAVLGGYFLLYPRARVVTVILFFIFPWIMEISALVFLGFWFISQLYSGFLSLSMPANASTGGIAWWAHVGGFVFGMLTVYVFARPLAPKTYFNSQWPPDRWPPGA